MRFDKKDYAVVIPTTLLAIAGLGPDDPWIIGPCLIFSWLTSLAVCAFHESSRTSRVIAAVIITLALGAVGYRRLLPLIPPTKTESKLEYNRIDIFKNYDFVAPNEKLGFKIILRNSGTSTLSLTRFVIVTAIAKADNEFIPNLIGHLEQAVRTAIKEPPAVKGGEIPPGRETSDDTVITLEPDQARGLSDGTMRLYFLVWWAWKGSDGKYGSDQLCMWMPQPKTSIIGTDEMRGKWERCIMPEPIEYRPN
jgi:hypothetical protein